MELRHAVTILITSFRYMLVRCANSASLNLLIVRWKSSIKEHMRASFSCLQISCALINFHPFESLFRPGPSLASCYVFLSTLSSPLHQGRQISFCLKNQTADVETTDAKKRQQTKSSLLLFFFSSLLVFLSHPYSRNLQSTWRIVWAYYNTYAFASRSSIVFPTTLTSLPRTSLFHKQHAVSKYLMSPGSTGNRLTKTWAVASCR